MGASRLLAVWTLITLLFYTLILPTRGHVGRYQPQLYLLILLLMVEGIGTLYRRGKLIASGTVVAGALLTVGVVGGGVEQSGLWCAAVRHLQHVHARAALALPSLLPPGSRVAVFDVGEVAYRTSGSPIDLSGLSDPTVARALPNARQGSIVRLLRVRGATHILLPVIQDRSPSALAERLGFYTVRAPQLRELARWSSSREDWGPAFHFTGNAFRQLILYQLEWPG